MVTKIKNQLVTWDEPIVMGILNLTPDSFYSGSRITKEHLVEQASQMLADGAKILDIGGHSTRPNASEVSEKEELVRVIPAIEAILTAFPEAIISIDSFRANVARAAIQAGASIINDVYSGRAEGEAMFETVADLKVPYILMHSRGDFTNMSEFTQYQNLTDEVILELQKNISTLRALGVSDIWIDPGFGFAKSPSQNFELLSQLERLKVLELPILVGLSRKSLIWKTLGVSPEEALNGTTALNMVALQKGAYLLRVHDVKEAVECIKLFKSLKFGIDF